MPRFLISFPSERMVIPDDEWQAVGEASHAVVREMKAAGVWIWGGGIDEEVPPVLVDASGAVIGESYPGSRLEGGYSIIETATRDEALHWAGRIAEACRCAQEVRQWQFDPES